MYINLYILINLKSEKHLKARLKKSLGFHLVIPVEENIAWEEWEIRENNFTTW